MKKSVCILVCVVVLSLVVCGIALFNLIENNKIEAFSISEYKEEIQEFPSDVVVGEVPTAQIAKEKAEVVWLDAYGEKIRDEKPYKVYFDDKQDVWLVTGSLPQNPFAVVFGGVAYILVEKDDGKVLAIWHDQ